MPPAFFTWLASTAFTYGTFAVTWGMVISASLAVYGVLTGQAAARRAKREYNASLQDRHVMLKAADVPRTVFYGRARVSGPIPYGCSSGAKEEYLHLVIALAGHEIDAVEEVWFNDENIGPLDAQGYVTEGPYFKEVTAPQTHKATIPASPYQITLPFVPTAVSSIAIPLPGAFWDSESQFITLAEGVDYTRAGAVVTFIAAHQGKNATITYTSTQAGAFVRVKAYLGTNAQTADPDLIAASGGEWTSAHRGLGVPYLYVTLLYNPDIFPTGVPNISAVGRGKKVYDPRTTLTAWSANSALCTRDYITDPIYGFSAASTELVESTFIAAANVSDEQITAVTSWMAQVIQGTTTHARYACDGVVGSDAAPKDNLQAILSSMAGVARYVGGYWSIRAGAYSAPTDTLTARDLADGTISVVARAPRRDLFNAVRGRFVDPLSLYALHDYPPYASSVYAAEDGGEVIYADIDLPMTNNHQRAQRITRLTLHQARQALTIEATWNLRAYKFAAGDTLMLTLDRYGFASKPFRVLDRRLMPEGKIKLVLREEAPAIYDWTHTEAAGIDAAPNTALPDVRIVQAIVGLTVASGASYYKQLSDGTIVPEAKISWTALTDSQVLQGGYIEVWFKRAIATEWQQVRLAPDAVDYRILVSRGEVINVSVRAVNGAQVRGAWSYATHTVSTAAPLGAQYGLNGALSNEAHVIQTLVDGSGGSFAGAAGTFKVYFGLTDVSAQATFAEVSEVGCTGTINATTGAYAVSAMSQDWATYSMTATYQGTVITKTFSLSKSKTGATGATGPAGEQGTTGATGNTGPQGPQGVAGDGAQVVTLIATGEVFTYDGTGAASPSTQTIYFTAALQNLGGAATFLVERFNAAGTLIDNTVTLGGTGNIARTLTNAQFGAAYSARITATHTGQSDVITIYRLQAGATGATGATGSTGSTGAAGADAYTVVLSNEAHTVVCDSAGTPLAGEIGAGGKAFTDILVWRGTTQLTPVAVGATPTANQFRYNVGTPVGGTAARTDDDTYRLETIAADSGSIPVTVWLGGLSVSVTKTFTFSKAKTGATGATGPTGLTGNTGSTGAAGADAQYVIVTGEQAFKFLAGSATPVSSSITLTAALFGGLSTYDWEYWNGSSWANLSGTQTNSTYALAYNNAAWGAATALRVRCLSGSVWDETTIVKLYDGAAGATGSTGATGANAISALLTNEAHTVAADKDGVVGTFAGVDGFMRVYDGVNNVTASATFSVFASSNVTGTINTADNTPVGSQLRGYYQVTAMAADVGTLTLRAVYGGVTHDKVFTVTKSKTGATGTTGATGAQGNPGTDATYVTVTGEQAFKFLAGQAIPVSTSTTLTAALFGGLSTYDWEYWTGAAWANLSGTQNASTYALAYNNVAWGSATALRVRCLSGTKFDEITIVKLYDGAAGATGSTGSTGAAGANAISALLTNETHAVPADKDGVVASFTGVDGFMRVYDGATVATASATFSVVTQTGLTGTINTADNTPVAGQIKGYYRVTAMSADMGTLAVRAVYGGVTHDKVFTVTKAKTGATGATGSTGSTGSAGADAQYVVVNGVQAFKFLTGQSIPVSTSITLAASLYGGLSAYDWEYWNGSAWTNLSGTQNAATYSLAYDNAAWGSSTALRIRCLSGAAYDEITVLKLYDGAQGPTGNTGNTGSTGAAGADAYTVVLSNETHAIVCDSGGTPIANEIGSAGKAKSDILVWKGTTALTPVSDVSTPGAGQFRYNIGTVTGGAAARTDNDTFYLNTISADSGSIPVTVWLEGLSVSVSKLFTFVKTKAGATGATGNTGATGAQGAQGATGARGTVSLARSITGSTWSDTEANTAVSAAGYGSPVERDLVTLYNAGAGYSETKFYTSGAWTVITQYLAGNLFIDGTLSATKITAGTITTNKLVDGSATEVSYAKASSTWDSTLDATFTVKQSLAVTIPAAAGGSAVPVVVITLSVDLIGAAAQRISWRLSRDSDATLLGSGVWTESGYGTNVAYVTIDEPGASTKTYQLLLKVNTPYASCRNATLVAEVIKK